MRWLPFILCVLLVVVLQSSVAWRIELGGARPDWLLVVVVFFSLYARGLDAVFGAYLIGACADLLSIERFGLLSLSYGLAALLILAVREELFRYRASTQFILTLVVCGLIRLGWLGYRLTVYPQAGWMWPGLAVDVVGVSLYTAVWAPPIHKLLLLLSRQFGLPRRRYTHAGSVKL